MNATLFQDRLPKSSLNHPWNKKYKKSVFFYPNFWINYRSIRTGCCRRINLLTAFHRFFTLGKVYAGFPPSNLVRCFFTSTSKSSVLFIQILRSREIRSFFGEALFLWHWYSSYTGGKSNVNGISLKTILARIVKTGIQMRLSCLIKKKLVARFRFWSFQPEVRIYLFF